MAANLLASSLFQLLSWGDQGYADELVFGALATLGIGLAAYALGLVLGLAAAMARLSAWPALRGAGWLYATVFRAVPELVLILLLYYAGSDLINLVLRALGLGPVGFSGAAAAIAVLGLVQGAYACEVLRGAILAVPRGYVEAALSLGFSSVQAFRRITVPLMLPLALPGLANLWLSLTKATALVSIVGYSELTLATTQAAGTSKYYFTFYCLAMALYLWIAVVSSRLFARAERHLTRGQQPLLAEAR